MKPKIELPKRQRDAWFLRQRQREQALAELAREQAASGAGPLWKAVRRRNRVADG